MMENNEVVQKPKRKLSPLALIGIGCATIVLISCICGVGFAVMSSLGGKSNIKEAIKLPAAEEKKNTTEETIPQKEIPKPEEQKEETPSPINLNGSGKQATSKFELKKGLAVFKLTNTGDSNFIIQLLDNNGQSVEYIVNIIGTFNGSRAFGIQQAGTYILDVTGGTWSVIIEQPRASSAASATSFSGSSQQATQLFQLNSGLKTFKMTHSGSSNFIVVLMDKNGNRVETLANEIGNFNGSKAVGILTSGIYLLDVVADGNWTITIE